MYSFFLRFTFLSIISGLAARAASPEVMVSIPPLHSLVAGITAGIDGGQPGLLMSGNDSPHTHALKPNEVRQLESAKVIVWIGSIYETRLQKLMDQLKRRSGIKIITIMDLKGLTLYPHRTGGLWEEHSHDHSDISTNEHGEHTHEPLSTDGHLWLDPHNCKIIVTEIAKALAAHNPQYAAHYYANAEKVIRRLEGLDQELKQKLQPVKEKPYLVFHDGMQYFDRRYHTKAIGSVTIDPEIPAGGQHLLRLRSLIKEARALCVFSESQFDPKAVAILIKNSGINTGVLDYLGGDLPQGEDQYFVMMHRLADALIKGLTTSS